LTTIEETITKLVEMKLVSMAQAVRDLMETAPGHQLSFDEKLGLVVDREWTERDNRRLSRRLKDAKLATRASLDNVLCDPERGIDKATMRGLSSCQWITSKHNIVIVGRTGVGKSYVVSALADAACRQSPRRWNPNGPIRHAGSGSGPLLELQNHFRHRTRLNNQSTNNLPSRTPTLAMIATLRRGVGVI
jgi:DNA replication protein DnaC